MEWTLERGSAGARDSLGVAVCADNSCGRIVAPLLRDYWSAQPALRRKSTMLLHLTVLGMQHATVSLRERAVPSWDRRQSCRTLPTAACSLLHEDLIRRDVAQHCYAS